MSHYIKSGLESLGESIERGMRAMAERPQVTVIINAPNTEAPDIAETVRRAVSSVQSGEENAED